MADNYDIASPDNKKSSPPDAYKPQIIDNDNHPIDSGLEAEHSHWGTQKTRMEDSYEAAPRGSAARAIQTGN